MSSTRSLWASVAMAGVLATGPAGAQEAPVDKATRCAALEADPFADIKDVVKAGCTPSPAQISKLLENPVSNFVSIPLQYDYVTVAGGPLGDTKVVQRLQVTPTFPLPLGSDWNLINRVVFALQSVPFNEELGGCVGMAPSELLSCPTLPEVLHDPFDRTTGFGDMVYAGVAAPKTSRKIASTGAVLVWGAGLTSIVPTASEKVLGSGKFSLGPTGVVAYLGKTWQAAVFPQHWWSVAGDGDRSEVNLTSIQYFLFYTPPGLDPNAAWRIGMSPIASVDWTSHGDRLTLPIGLGVGRMLTLGGLPLDVHGEVDYSVVRPDGRPGSRWDFRVDITAVIPTFVF